MLQRLDTRRAGSITTRVRLGTCIIVLWWPRQYHIQVGRGVSEMLYFGVEIAQAMPLWADVLLKVVDRPRAFQGCPWLSKAMDGGVSPSSEPP